MQIPQDLIDDLLTFMRNDYEYSLWYRQACDGLHLMGWKGFYRYMHNISHDHRHYAHMVARYLTERGVLAQWSPIGFDNPPSGGDPVACFKAYADKEQEWADEVNALYEKAEDAEDEQTCEFLDCFLKKATKVVAKARYKEMQISRVAGDMAGLQFLDAKWKEKRA